MAMLLLNVTSRSSSIYRRGCGQYDYVNEATLRMTDVKFHQSVRARDSDGVTEGEREHCVCRSVG